MQFLLKAAAVTIIFIVLVSCSGGNSTQVNQGNQSGTGTASLTDTEYNSLSSENQYNVANILSGTLYKGVPVRTFFAVSAGFSSPTISGGQNYISRTRAALSTPVADRQDYIDLIDQKYYFSEDYKPMQYPLAMLYEFPLSKDYFDIWMAYTLATTILFSPAVELDSVDVTDIQKVMYRLTTMIREDNSIRDIVYTHITSQENWRRFRSPEDNTREMMEIYLLRFRDDEVPKAAKCCRNWHLSDGDQGYQLLIGYNENDEPQRILDTIVLGCHDFFRAVANHASLIPAITSRLVDRFFPNATAAEKANLVNGISGSNPTTFRQLFLSIIFSRQYLLNTNRTKYYEETFFNAANRLGWVPDMYFFYNLNPQWGSGIEDLSEMKQASFSYKLGRKEIPLDSLSFAYYHKSLRERMMINRWTYEGDSGWKEDLYNSVTITGNDYIHYLFLTAIGRKADAGELALMNSIISSKGYSNNTSTNRRNIALFVLDYCSRLSELYIQRAVY
jgi:hypothetical protein